VGFEPTTTVFGLAKTVHALDRAVTVIALDIIRVIKSSRMAWTGLAVRMGELRNTYKILIRKP
jgi:hypothetical protein